MANVGNPTEGQLEGVRQLGEWCKWYSGISISAIAFMGAIKYENGIPDLSKWFWSVAVGLFIFNLLITGIVLLGLPTIAQDLKETESIWDRPIFWGVGKNDKITLWKFVIFQMVLFILGTMTFGIGVIGILWH